MKFGTQMQIWNYRLQLYDEIWQLLKFKIMDSRHFKNRFGHNSAADCPISEKICVRKQFFTEFR